MQTYELRLSRISKSGKGKNMALKAKSSDTDESSDDKDSKMKPYITRQFKKFMKNANGKSFDKDYRLATKKLSDVELNREKLSTKFDEDIIVSVDLSDACETLRKELSKSLKISKKFKEKLKLANLEKEELIVRLDESNKKNEFLRNKLSSKDEKMKSFEQKLVEVEAKLENLFNTKLVVDNRPVSVSVPIKPKDKIYIPPFKRIHKEKAYFARLDKEEFHRISHISLTKEAWQILETMYEGTKKVKDTKLQMLTTRFEELKMSEDESFDSFYNKLNEVVIGKFNMGEKTEDSKVVRKILRSLPESFCANVTMIEESKDLDDIKVQ
ncbi:uncharacterized protein LOC136066802 [Quercus suber]|uniref:uncharacterized protein LOC136066802 n=1 Tax=Quercus suber TaxID=58331 RepID=UPI0032DEC45E